ncbi:Metalloenzyme, LuxS/M16 peptidase-like protein [Schizophyllum commune]
MATSESFGNFDLVKRVKLDYTAVEVSKWRSRDSGLSIVHIDYEAPIVKGYFVVATEIFDDSGCPHTLEHLVFMGSEKYPYKGIIDHFANRGFSNGTNAWTDDDHTAYTASTAGAQGFLQLLPIYVDHILYPTLTKSGFVTEVHHIDPQGKDSGVVYSEMQGRENTSGDLMALRLNQLSEPEGSAYRSETGGLMAALRKLTVEKIRDYHHKYYVPHNLSLIVAGKLTGGTESLLRVAQEQIETSIVAHGQNKGIKPTGWKRPFLETPSAPRPPFEKTIKDTIEFPEKDESVGELVINFLGPPPNEFVERKALDILGTYLTSSTVAPLNKEYIEIESPMCTYIYMGQDTRATKIFLPIYIGSVPTELLDTFDEKLKASFQNIVKTGIDMDRMRMVIDRDERQFRSKLESSKGDAFSDSLITDFLYGAEDGSDIKRTLEEDTWYAQLKAWDSKRWTDLLSKYYIDQHSIVLRGKPSASLVDKLEKDEKERIAKQVEALGPEGLKKAEQELNEAKAEHDKPIPTEILNTFPVPDVKSIAWIPVQSVVQKGKGRQSPAPAQNATALSTHINADGSELPFFVEYDHVESDFVTIHAFFDLKKLPDHLRPYATLYASAFFSLPIKRASGEALTHEEVVNRLDDETVSYEVSQGVSSGFAESFRLSIKAETAQYETAIAWMHDLLYGPIYDRERLQVTVAKVQSALPELKRDGSTVLSAVWSDAMYSERSTARAGTVLQQTEFIPKVAEQLQQQPEEVAKIMAEVRDTVAQPSGVRFSVTGNILALSKPRSTFEKHFGTKLPSVELEPVTFTSDVLSDLGRNPAKKAIVMSLPTIESSFVTHTSKGIQGFGDAEYPAMRVALEVMNATESYLWRYIRGSGLAYGAYMSIDLEAGLTSFSLYRSSNSVGAFEQAKKVVEGLCDGTIPLDTTTMDAAKSSIVYGVTKTVSTASRAALTSFVNQTLKGVPQNYQSEILAKTQTVTIDDVLQSIRKYFLPLFDAKQSMVVAVTAPGKADEVAAGLAKEGFDVERRSMHIDESEMDGSESESGSDDSDESQ